MKSVKINIILMIILGVIGIVSALFGYTVSVIIALVGLTFNYVIEVMKNNMID